MDVGVDVVDKAALTVPVQGLHPRAIYPPLVVAHFPNGEIHDQVWVELQLRLHSSQDDLELPGKRLRHLLQLGLDGSHQEVRVELDELGDGVVLHLWPC